MRTLQNKIVENNKIALAKVQEKSQQYRKLQSEFQTINSTIKNREKENAALHSKLTNQQVAAKTGHTELEQRILKLKAELTAKNQELEFAKKEPTTASVPVSTPAVT